jgi:hypothetical protein
LCKIGLGNKSFVALIEHSKGFSDIENSIGMKNLLVNFSVLINTDLHLNELGEFEFLRSLGLPLLSIFHGILTFFLV